MNDIFNFLVKLKYSSNGACMLYAFSTLFDLDPHVAGGERQGQGDGVPPRDQAVDRALQLGSAAARQAAREDQRAPRHGESECHGLLHHAQHPRQGLQALRKLPYDQIYCFFLA